MFRGSDWMTDWDSAEAVSSRIAEICALIPQRGSWEPNNQIAFAMASFRLAQEHHSSVYLLIQRNKYASANALARPLLEAGLRTIWLLEDASDAEISALAKGREFPILGKLNSRLSKRSKREHLLTGRHQGVLDSLTHGGSRAMGAQYLEGGKLEQVNAVMIAQGSMTLGAAGYSIAQRLGMEDILTQLIDATPIVD